MIHIIIPVHNRIDYTCACLYSLEKQKHQDFQVIVVNDGSTDGTLDILGTKFPEVTILNGDGQLWWTGAIAKGVEWVLNSHVNGSNHDYVMTLNNDVVLKPDTLEELLASIKIRPHSLVNAVSVRSDDLQTIVSSGSRVRSWLFNITSHPFHNQNYLTVGKSAIKVDMLTGRSVLYPLSVFREIGNFDAVHFPQYGGDSEFTCRARKNGWDLWIEPRAVVYVDAGATGDNPMNKNLTLREALESFGSIKSSNNLIIRTRFALRCVPWYAIPSYLLIMYLKIFVQSIFGKYIFKVKNTIV